LRVVIVKDYDEVGRRAAEFIAAAIRRKPDLVLGLATGSTPLGAYRELVRLRKEGLDFSRVKTFNLDEYFGIPHDHPQSYHRFMKENLFDHLNVKPENVSIPDGMAKDYREVCEEYERRINAAGGIDLQLLGIGRDGHIGFNEPGSSLASRTRLKTLTDQTLKDNSRFFGSEDAVPKLAVTMGVGTIMEAHRILLLASGPEKAQALKESLEGPVTSTITASVLQLHPLATFIVDEPAAAKLRWREYYLNVERLSREVGQEAGV
jgi:glucosamine-6-phosphate deaminase